MGYYRHRRYRSWRSRGWSASSGSGPSKYATLANLFGDALKEIRKSFLDLDEEALDELLSDYGAIHGESAEKYARKTYQSWKSGSTALSGQTMERLVELVPPYLSPEQRFSLLKLVLKRHKPSVPTTTIKINVKEPGFGFGELTKRLDSMSHTNVLAHLPDSVMKAASWLYDDDITAARAMVADAEKLENDLIRSSAAKEIELLKRTISTGQVKAASYSVKMPTGTLNVVAYSPSMCFVATRCFGVQATETQYLRQWRDDYLIEKTWGRRFIVWYYQHGEKIALLTDRSALLKVTSKTLIQLIIWMIRNSSERIKQ